MSRSFAQIRIRQVGLRKIRSIQTGTSEIRASQVSTAKVRSFENGSTEVLASQVLTGEVNANQLKARSTIRQF